MPLNPFFRSIGGSFGTAIFRAIFAIPAQRTSSEEIERALHMLASRESRYHFYQCLAAHAGVDLDPLYCWLLFRIQEQGPISQEDSQCTDRPTMQHLYGRRV